MSEEKLPVKDEVAQVAPMDSGSINSVEPVVDDVDERGVAWKNVAMEEKRKRTELEERIVRLESSIPATPVYAPPVQYSEPMSEAEAIVRNVIGNMKKQERLQETFNYITSNGLNIKELDKIIAEEYIAVDDPLKAAMKAHEHLRRKQDTNGKLVQEETQKKEVERKEKIKKTTTDGSPKPQAPTVNEIEEARKKFMENRDPGSLQDYYRKRLG